MSENAGKGAQQTQSSENEKKNARRKGWQSGCLTQRIERIEIKPVERGIKEPQKLAGNTRGTIKEKREPPMTSESDLQVQVTDYLRCSVGGCCRWANKFQQAWNKEKTRGSMRGIRKKGNSFIARIKADGKEISKSFDSLSDAVEFRAKMEEKYARA